MRNARRRVLPRLGAAQQTCASHRTWQASSRGLFVSPAFAPAPPLSHDPRRSRSRLPAGFRCRGLYRALRGPVWPCPSLSLSRLACASFLVPFVPPPLSLPLRAISRVRPGVCVCVEVSALFPPPRRLCRTHVRHPHVCARVARRSDAPLDRHLRPPPPPPLPGAAPPRKSQGDVQEKKVRTAFLSVLWPKRGPGHSLLARSLLFLFSFVQLRSCPADSVVSVLWRRAERCSRALTRYRCTEHVCRFPT